MENESREEADKPSEILLVVCGLIRQMARLQREKEANHRADRKPRTKKKLWNAACIRHISPQNMT